MSLRHREPRHVNGRCTPPTTFLMPEDTLPVSVHASHGPGQLQPPMMPLLRLQDESPLKSPLHPIPLSPCITVTSLSPETAALDHLTAVVRPSPLQTTLTVQAETSRGGLCVQASLVTCDCVVSGQCGHCWDHGVHDGFWSRQRGQNSLCSKACG